MGDGFWIRTDAGSAARVVASLRGSAASFYWDGKGCLFVTLPKPSEEREKRKREGGILHLNDS